MARKSLCVVYNFGTMNILRAKTVVIRSLFRYIFFLKAKEEYRSGTSN